MNDFVGTSSPLRKALWVAMASMHFHIAKIGLFKGCFAFRGSQGTIWHQFKIVLGMQGRSN